MAVFGDIYARTNKIFIFAAGLDTRLSFYDT